MRVKIFDDIKSMFHVVLGFTACSAFPYGGFALAAVFAAYQLLESEDIESKAGDFIEFSLGCLASAVLVFLDP